MGGTQQGELPHGRFRAIGQAEQFGVDAYVQRNHAIAANGDIGRGGRCVVVRAIAGRDGEVVRVVVLALRQGPYTKTQLIENRTTRHHFDVAGVFTFAIHLIRSNALVKYQVEDVRRNQLVAGTQCGGNLGAIGCILDFLHSILRPVYEHAAQVANQTVPESSSQRSGMRECLSVQFEAVSNSISIGCFSGVSVSRPDAVLDSNGRAEVGYSGLNVSLGCGKVCGGRGSGIAIFVLIVQQLVRGGVLHASVILLDEPLQCFAFITRRDDAPQEYHILQEVLQFTVLFLGQLRQDVFRRAKIEAKGGRRSIRCLLGFRYFLFKFNNHGSIPFGLLPCMYTSISYGRCQELFSGLCGWRSVPH